MAIITNLENQASVVYNGQTISSNSVDTILLLAPLLLKTVDKLTASIGETLTYTIVITNVGLSSLTNLPFTDVLPEGSEYIENSFTLNEGSVTPTLIDNTLTYTIPNIGPLGIATITFQIEVVGSES